VLCKLDIEKTYDNVNWDFLLVKGMKFQGEMTFLDSTFIFLVCFSVLVNDNPFGFFSNSCSLKQGDSL
jgi:hypothetical protein